MTTTIGKRSLSLLLAVVLCLMAFVGIGSTTAYAAAGETDEVYLISFPRDGDEHLDYSGSWGHGELQYMNGWSTSSTLYTTVHAIGSFTGTVCYCIEPGVPLNIGDTLTKWGEDFWENYPSDYNHTIEPYEIKQFIGRIMQYGYTGNVSTSWRSQNEGGDTLAYATATQLLVWETVVGERDSDFNHVSPGSYDAVLDQIGSNHPLRSRIMSYYSSIENSVKTHSKLPSFMKKTAGSAESIELAWDGSKYTASLTDTSGVLGNYTFSGSGLSFSVSGNTLTVTAQDAPADTVTITAEKNGGQRRGVITWTDGHYGPGGSTLQDLVTYTEAVNDPIKGFLKVKVSYGSAKIVKTSEDDKVSGISFTITGNGVNQTVKTDRNGEITVNNLAPGVYTVTEQTADKYVPQESRTVTVVSGRTASVTFNNTLKRGNLTVTKDAEDGLCEGAKFHLSGTSLSGLAVNEYAEAGKDGKAYFTDVLIGSGYTLEEVDTPARYVVPGGQNADILWNEVTEKTVTNTLKKWCAEVKKTDSERTDGTAQGDATLQGAVYGVYRDGALLDSYTTDEAGSFITDYYPCYDDVVWTIREISPSEGYLLDPTVYTVDTDVEKYTAERNTEALTVNEAVIKGRIAIIKHTDDGSTKIETPEEGAVFAVYRKASGSYDNAKPTERCMLTCDENGFAQSIDLPYGVYMVEQTEGWEGRELLPAFAVNIAKHGEVYRFLINNANFTSYLRVVKVDATTGKTIPYAGAGFQILTPEGTLVTMSSTYPGHTKLDTFYTGEDGELLTPEKLPYGKGYALIEVQAPHGYVLDDSPLYFDVTAGNAVSEDGITVVKVTKENQPQKGKISVIKTGEVFASVTETDNGYTTVYEEKGLAGAVYEIIAAEDIVTPEGTVRYTKDQVVETITTEESGKAESQPLFLGLYTVREVTAPYGMTVNTDPVNVKLTYAGQEVAVTTAEASFVNDRQKIKISLVKALEQDETFGIGNNGEICAVQFGLYAQEAIVAADGGFIPKDALIETVTCGESGSAVFTTDLPIGAKLYVKELTTDSRYLLSEESYPVTFEYAGQDTAVVEIALREGEAIQNKLIRGSIMGKKLDEDGGVIANALFGLYHEQETEFSEETAILTAHSGEDGIFTFEDVPYGRWIVREIKAAPAFVLNENNYAVTVAADSEVVEITIENAFITGSVTTTKVDAEYPDNKLTGAVFEIYLDVDGDGSFDADEDSFVGELTETEAGVYAMHDLRYGGYFLYEKTAPEGFLKDESYHYFEIREDGETVCVENEAGIGFTNKPMTGELELTKTDIADGKPLAKVGFRIRNEAGEIILEGYTDENGVARFTLRCGKYTYEEFAPLSGYVPDENAYPFEISEHGEIIKATMTNEKAPVPDIPQTGDDSNLGFWIGLAAIALGGVIASAVMFVKKKKDDDGE